MRKVFKYALKPQDRTTLWLPKGTQILSVQLQDGHAQLWALVYPQRDLEERTLLIVGTGHPIEDQSHLVFIDTLQYPALGLVYHVFEVLPPQNFDEESVDFP